MLRNLHSHLVMLDLAPSGELSLMERQYAYLRHETPDTAYFSSSLTAAVNVPGTSGINLMSRLGSGPHHVNLGRSLGANDLSKSGISTGFMSPHRSLILPTSGIVMENSFDMLGFDHGCNRRAESSTALGVVDTKHQYQLNLDRILRGEDNRTILMIKNIPSKYLSILTSMP